jgi:hypothetical protein
MCDYIKADSDEAYYKRKLHMDCDGNMDPVKKVQQRLGFG